MALKFTRMTAERLADNDAARGYEIEAENGEFVGVLISDEAVPGYARSWWFEPVRDGGARRFSTLPEAKKSLNQSLRA